ncbi:hypothetical protein F4801DRAFT_167713 [Xylaria longipes]|nr:hypothetical protein F4801DRAFT_167713 [Xylaria longipes]
MMYMTRVSLVSWMRHVGALCLKCSAICHCFALDCFNINDIGVMGGRPHYLVDSACEGRGVKDEGRRAKGEG